MSFVKYMSVRITSKADTTKRIATNDSIFDWSEDAIAYTPGSLLVRTRAISARVNKNYDAWPSSELEKSYRTFIGKPVFVNHENYDVERTRGMIVDARYKVAGDDKYVELVIEVDQQTFPRLAEEIKSGRLDSVSMGANIEYSVCSIQGCENKAVDATDFCDHVLSMKGTKVANDVGEMQLVYENCYNPSFFEISFVFDPADETALIQEVYNTKAAQKVATKTSGRITEDWFEDGFSTDVSEARGEDSQGNEVLLYVERDETDDTWTVTVQDQGWNSLFEQFGVATEDEAKDIAESFVRTATIKTGQYQWYKNGNEPNYHQFTSWGLQGPDRQYIAYVSQESPISVFEWALTGVRDGGQTSTLKEAMEAVETALGVSTNGSIKMTKRVADTSDILRTPESVDTLREESICPECKDDSFDGQTCLFCGFTEYLDGLGDPDTDTHYEQTLEQAKSDDEAAEDFNDSNDDERESRMSSKARSRHSYSSLPSAPGNDDYAKSVKIQPYSDGSAKFFCTACGYASGSYGSQEAAISGSKEHWLSSHAADYTSSRKRTSALPGWKLLNGDDDLRVRNIWERQLNDGYLEVSEGLEYEAISWEYIDQSGHPSWSGTASSLEEAMLDAEDWAYNKDPFQRNSHQGQARTAWSIEEYLTAGQYKGWDIINRPDLNTISLFKEVGRDGYDALVVWRSTDSGNMGWYVTKGLNNVVAKGSCSSWDEGMQAAEQAYGSRSSRRKKRRSNMKITKDELRFIQARRKKTAKLLWKPITGPDAATYPNGAWDIELDGHYAWITKDADGWYDLSIDYSDGNEYFSDGHEFKTFGDAAAEGENRMATWSSFN